MLRKCNIQLLGADGGITMVICITVVMFEVGDLEIMRT